MTDKIKVMLVDDSAVIRGFLSHALTQDPDIDIVSSVSNGEMAVNMVDKTQPDVILLDIEMPVMDGIEAIPHILKLKPDAKILMCSSLSEKGASITLKALSIGATDCIVKPSNADGVSGGKAFQDELLKLVRNVVRKPKQPPQPSSQGSQAIHAKPALPRNAPLTLRNDPSDYTGRPSIIAIGSSTGGPQALFKVLPHFKDFNIPVVLTQHMPKTFTAILAEHIQTNCAMKAKEGANGMIVDNGTVYVAPGGFHMTLTPQDKKIVIRLQDTPPENFCKPSVDPMMNSVIDIYGKRALGVMLTGMGHDGLKSFTTLTEHGGRVIAQDEKTSVVWGMPGAVAQKGICSAVLPIEDIGPWVKSVVH